MIFYNMRYRGAYEYDKFILNTFQYSNMINDFIHDTTNSSTWKTLFDVKNQIDNLFMQSTDVGGKSDKIYKLLIMNRGE